MKKVLFLAALLLVCFSGVTNAQTRKQREDAKREAWKKERQEKKALEAQQDSVSYVQAINALKNGSFVLEADNVVFRNGIMRFVSSNTNYVEVNDGQGIIQTAFRLMGLNGLEPSTSRLSGVRSNQLSYKPIFFGAYT